MRCNSANADIYFFFSKRVCKGKSFKYHWRLKRFDSCHGGELSIELHPSLKWCTCEKNINILHETSRKNQLLPRAKTCTYRTTFRKMNKNNSLPPEGFPLRVSVCATSVGFPFSFRLRSVIWFGSGGSRRTLTCFVGEDIFFTSIYVGSVKRIEILRQGWIRKSHSRPLVSVVHLRFNGCLCELNYARALSARFSLTGGRSNYEQTVGEKNSPQWLRRSGALREQKPEKQKQIMIINVQEDRKQRERPDVMNGNRKFCFSRIIVLYHSPDLLSWHNLVCERSVKSRLISFHFFFRDGQRLCTQANTTKFGSICFYPAFGTTLSSNHWRGERSLVYSSRW